MTSSYSETTDFYILVFCGKDKNGQGRMIKKFFFPSHLSFFLLYNSLTNVTINQVTITSL